MVRGFPQYFTPQQLRKGIAYEMSCGADQKTAERLARQKLSQSPRYYDRVQAMRPTFKQDRRRYRRLAKKKMADRMGNNSPFNQGSLF